MNIALEKTEEWVNGQKRRTYGDAFVRGNNGTLPPPFPPLSLAIPRPHAFTDQSENPQSCTSPPSRRAMRAEGMGHSSGACCAPGRSAALRNRRRSLTTPPSAVTMMAVERERTAPPVLRRSHGSAPRRLVRVMAARTKDARMAPWEYV